MEILFGAGLVLFLEGLAWVGWRAWYKATKPPPQPPLTAAQQANRTAFETERLGTPRVRRLRLQRRITRGGNKRNSGG